MRTKTKRFFKGAPGSFPFLLFLPLLLAGCSAGGAAQVLGIPRERAAELLAKGDTGFIREAVSPAAFPEARSRLTELFRVHPAAPFYAGLLAEEDKKFAVLLFSAALESPLVPARREATLALLPMILETGEDSLPPPETENILKLLERGKTDEGEETFLPLLRAACLYRLGRYTDAVETLPKDSPEGWEKALALFAAWKAAAGTPNTETLRAQIEAFLFDSLPGLAPGGDFRRWVYEEALSLEGFPGAASAAALEAKGFPGGYETALAQFRPALTDGGLIFFRYPELIADLGSAFQYTPGAREEGAGLFAAWDRLFADSAEASGLSPALSDAAAITANQGFPHELAAFVKTLDRDERRERRYLILYYAGRIERARENYDESSEYFGRALELAPGDLSGDSCIWYMLMNAPEKETAALALATMPRWKDMSYFDDVLDSLSSRLVAARDWDTLFEIFTGLEKRKGGVSRDRYAWILGRAAEEGYFKSERSAESFFRFIHENAERGSFYYRALAAAKLGKSFNPLSGAGKHSAGEKPDFPGAKDELEFLLGFFECGAASFALPYILAREEELAAPGLRKIAEAFAAAGKRKESLDLVSRYLGRAHDEISREDLLLFYPRPFKESVEKYAREMKLGPGLLYGLIRTESYFQNAVVSRSGAVGLAQLMPSTARDMAGRIARQGGPDYRGEDGTDPALTDPAVNIHIASFYLRYLTEQMGSPMPALLAYNGGMGRMRRWLAADRARGALPPDLFPETVEITETREYGRRVLAAAAIYGWLYYGKSAEETVAEIFR